MFTEDSSGIGGVGAIRRDFSTELEHERIDLGVELAAGETAEIVASIDASAFGPSADCECGRRLGATLNSEGSELRRGFCTLSLPKMEDKRPTSASSNFSLLRPSWASVSAMKLEALHSLCSEELCIHFMPKANFCLVTKAAFETPWLRSTLVLRSILWKEKLLLWAALVFESSSSGPMCKAWSISRSPRLNEAGAMM